MQLRPFALVALLLAAPLALPSPSADASATDATVGAFFEPQRGQLPPGALAMARGAGVVAHLGADGIAWHVAPARVPFDPLDPPVEPEPAPAVRVRFEGAALVAPRLEAPLAAVSHHFGPFGAVPSVPRFARAVYDELWPGVSLVLRDDGAGRLEYDLHVAPGADASRARFAVEGAPLALAEDGALLAGPLAQRAPVAYQDARAGRVAVESAFVVEGSTFSFAVGPHDATLPLVVDPVVERSMRVGGTGADAFHDAAWLPDGSMVAVGTSFSADHPVRAPLQGERRGANDAIVARFAADGTLLSSTYFGGMGAEQGLALELAPNGDIVVAGITASADLPTRNASQPAYAGGSDLFVAILSPDASALRMATYHGGPEPEVLWHGLAVDDAGDVHLAGISYSDAYPAPALCTASSASFVAVAKFRASGQRVYSACFVGRGASGALDVDVDASGRAVFGGYADYDVTRQQFPTTPDAIVRATASAPGIVGVVHADGSGLAYSTYLAPNDDIGPGTRVWAIRVLPDGSLLAAGDTGFHYPLQNETMRHQGRDDAFLSRWFPGQRSFVYSTSYGGPADEYVQSIEPQPDGTVLLGGISESDAAWPREGAVQVESAGARDGFVLHLDPFARRALRSTLLGGHDLDYVTAVHLDDAGRAHAVGYTFSSSFLTEPATPTPAPSDAFWAILGDGAPRTASAPRDATQLPPTSPGTVTLSWQPPLSQGGAPVTRYTLYDATTGAFLGEVKQATRFTDVGLAEGETRRYRVHATNLAGEGEAALVVGVAPRRPDEPLGLRAYVEWFLPGIVELRWEPPAFDGGLPVTSYRVYHSFAPDDPGTMVDEVPASQRTLEYVAEPGIGHYFRVSAVNAVAEGAFSARASTTALEPPFAVGTGQVKATGLVWHAATTGCADLALVDVTYDENARLLTMAGASTCGTLVAFLAGCEGRSDTDIACADAVSSVRLTRGGWMEHERVLANGVARAYGQLQRAD